MVRRRAIDGSPLESKDQCFGKDRRTASAARLRSKRDSHGEDEDPYDKNATLHGSGGRGELWYSRLSTVLRFPGQIRRIRGPHLRFEDLTRLHSDPGALWSAGRHSYGPFLLTCRGFRTGPGCTARPATLPSTAAFPPAVTTRSGPVGTERPQGAEPEAWSYEPLPPKQGRQGRGQPYGSAPP